MNPAHTMYMMPTIATATRGTFTLDLVTAREFLQATEPHVIEDLRDLSRHPKTGVITDQVQALANVDIELAPDTAKAEKLSREAGLPPSAEGRYPVIVWFKVFP